ncbi:MAG: glutamyl-tRNA reductase [Candidatus Riflebacteria bacterium]|nr:glutamyl-tRNA reductase [Candidatus Riflebacteria bacterium]
MPLLMIGMNHKTAPVELRERLNGLCSLGFPSADGRELEAVPIFTCNRVEFYFHGPEALIEEAFATWRVAASLPDALLEGCLYRMREAEAVLHLLRVSSGLDSLVLGENQILHQVKSSYQAAIEAKSIGKRLHALFQKALEVGKRVRSETKLSENTVSIASTAVDLAMRVFGPLGDCHALVVGAGEMAGLVARHLKSRGIGRMTFTNRTQTRAEELAATFQGRAAPFERLAELIVEADLLITSTGAQRPILTPKDLSGALSKRPYRPLFAIDIAVPRDIAPGHEDIENLFVYDVDDLQGVVDENFDRRRVEAEKAETIASYEAHTFQFTLDAYSAVPLIRRLRERVEEMRVSEFDKFVARSGSALPPDIIAAFDQCTKSLAAKWLHAPILALKEQSGGGREDMLKIAVALGLPVDVVPMAPLSTVPKSARSAQNQNIDENDETEDTGS